MTPVGCDAGPIHVYSKHMAEDTVSARLCPQGSNPLGVEFNVL